ncbi:MAG: FliM/FliN family flagellar motor switch protein [Janthinobacterium lividum]
MEQNIPEQTAAASSEEELSGTNLPETDDARSSQIERVIDVPLNVTLRFGERQMRLREVLDLNTGSLVELDRQVEAPVDLMLGERVIARGEVIIVDGNYGLRVLEVVERVPAPAAAA